jgi:glycosyltransferase involved in cell wall biosynthesis
MNEMGQTIQLSVLICTRNRLAQLRERPLPALFDGGLVGAGCEVVVVDHGSDDGTAEVIDRLAASHPMLRRVRVTPSASFGELRNAAIDAAKGDLVVFLDDDAVPSTGWVRAIVSRFAEDPELMAMGGPVTSGAGETIENEGWVKGANMAFRRSVFERYRFDPDLRYFGSIYFDEIDLVGRLIDDGLKVGYFAELSVRHFSASGSLGPAALLGATMNAVYSHCKKRGAVAHYRAVGEGLSAMARAPGRKTFERLRAESEWGVGETKWRALLLLKLGWSSGGVARAAAVLWCLLVAIPVRAGMRRRAERREMRIGTGPASGYGK